VTTVSAAGATATGADCDVGSSTCLPGLGCVCRNHGDCSAVIEASDDDVGAAATDDVDTVTVDVIGGATCLLAPVVGITGDVIAGAFEEIILEV